MSDKVSLYQAIKDNWAQVAAIAAVSSIFIGVVGEWRIRANVATALASVDIATDSKIVSMDDEIDENGAKAAANTTRIDGNERRVEQAFAALMGRPLPTE
jgi:hypothetical protein